METALSSFQSLADSLWAKIERLIQEQGRARIVMTGAEDGAGTTTITATTALALARNMRLTVRVIETNVERPGLAAALDVPATPGLSDLLDGRAILDDCWHEVHAVKGLRAVPSGRARRPVPGELSSEEGARALAELLDGKGLTLIDAPPLVGHAYARALLDHADGAVLVLRARSTLKNAAESTAKLLEAHAVPLLGSVLNRFKSDMPFGLGDGY